MVVIDTCSLLNISRYYLPFDTDNILYNMLQKGVEAREFIIIDKVYRQCTWVNDGEIIKAFPFLKKNQTSTEDCIPSPEFFRLVDNDFKSDDGRKLNPAEFEVQKTKFMADADVNMILFCYKHKSSLTPPRIVTDETGRNNDSKYFQKIPKLCELTNVGVISSMDFIKETSGVDIIIK